MNPKFEIKGQLMNQIHNIKSALFLPANRNDFIGKAHSRGATAIILDLEDSVADANKQEARENVAQASALLASQGMGVLIRTNSSWRLAVRDLEVCIGENVHCVVVPKASSSYHIQAVDEVITEIEIEKGLPVGHTKLIAFIESPEALGKATSIAQASDRLVGLSLGTEDFSTEVGSIPNRQTLYGPCQQIVFAARSAGIQPLGFATSIADFEDMEAFQETIVISREMGFRGACCIHPKQVQVLNKEFSPTAAEIENAEGIIAAFDEAVAKGLGAIAYKGQMIDAPVYNRAKMLLASV